MTKQRFPSRAGLITAVVMLVAGGSATWGAGLIGVPVGVWVIALVVILMWAAAVTVIHRDSADVPAGQEAGE